MRHTDGELLQRLSAVDPAAEHARPFSATERAVMRSAILAAAPDIAALGAANQRRTRPAVRVAGIASAIVLAIIAAVFAVPILWPQHTGGEAPMAYGITSKPDGSVDILLRWSQLDDVTAVQDALRAAGVPAVVLRMTSPCVDTVDPDGDRNSLAVEEVIHPADGQTGVVVRPSELPRGDYVVFGIPPLGFGFVSVSVTPVPPHCIAAPQSIPAPASLPAPAKS
jgi:hypothetical protein